MHFLSLEPVKACSFSPQRCIFKTKISQSTTQSTSSSITVPKVVSRKSEEEELVQFASGQGSMTGAVGQHCHSNKGSVDTPPFQVKQEPSRTPMLEAKTSDHNSHQRRCSLRNDQGCVLKAVSPPSKKRKLTSVVKSPAREYNSKMEYKAVDSCKMTKGSIETSDKDNDFIAIISDESEGEMNVDWASDLKSKEEKENLDIFDSLFESSQTTSPKNIETCSGLRQLFNPTTPAPNGVMNSDVMVKDAGLEGTTQSTSSSITVPKVVSRKSEEEELIQFASGQGSMTGAVGQHCHSNKGSVDTPPFQVKLQQEPSRMPMLEANDMDFFGLGKNVKDAVFSTFDIQKLHPWQTNMLIKHIFENKEQKHGLLLAPTHSDDLKQEKKNLVGHLLQESKGMVDSVLLEGIKARMGFHTAALHPMERKAMEDAFSEGLILALSCTSTLAAGVNLPASRVIIASPYTWNGNDLITCSSYLQQVGRAGRGVRRGSGDD
ncbi:Helicase POLQ-like [Frankliniella fusca]|uniref:Helicase POLQ-like n=1 Tax=Frankliniella fusca TaxID=407009 RepID=A0AAE1LN63_9NEOP|nr:Helicase POLQ-like [Frankliniella fusca]